MTYSISSRECEKSEQSKGLLDGVSEFNVLQITAHDSSSLRAVGSLDGLLKNTVSELVGGNLSVAARFHVVFASLNEGNLVVPPHDIPPVNL